MICCHAGGGTHDIDGEWNRRPVWLIKGGQIKVVVGHDDMACRAKNEAPRVEQFRIRLGRDAGLVGNQKADLVTVFMWILRGRRHRDSGKRHRGDDQKNVLKKEWWILVHVTLLSFTVIEHLA